MEKVEPFTRELRVDLSVKQVADRADKAAHMLADRDRKVAEFKIEKSAHKKVIDELEGEIRSLNAEVRERATHQEVQCERRFDYKSGNLIEVRKDTGEVLFERPLTADENQPELFPGDVDDEFGGDED